VKSGAKPRTDFSELAVPFTLQNGVFNTSETSLKSPLMRLLAAGKANLVKETLDFRLEPKLVGTIKGQGDEKKRSGVGVPILVSGSFSQPVFKPDLEGIAKDQLRKALDPTEGGLAPSLTPKPGDALRGILPGKK
jgi:AsmA protein